jgi:epoxyqueuosine reductase
LGKSKRRIGPGDVQRFDQKNNIQSRMTWDLLEIGKTHYGVHKHRDVPGYTMKDWAFAQGCWYVEKEFATGAFTGNYGLYEWYPDPSKIEKRDRMTPGEKWVVSDPEKMTRDIKKAAKLMGASLVGICKLDRRWVYSHSFHRSTHEYKPIDIPEEFEHAIVMAVDTPYELIQTSPSRGSYAAAGLGYQWMACEAGSLAHFIRLLGYKAIPSGNDTALCVPLAIDAGLGEAGRNGLLITEEFGPRVRISKVFTDLPLVHDKPIEFGVREFCETCKRCAEECPGRALPFGEPTTEPHNISNAGGAYKWYCDNEKCQGFWVRNLGACLNCVRVCPFNKPEGWIHDAARFIVRNASWLDPVLLRMNKAFGYGKRAKGDSYWE